MTHDSHCETRSTDFANLVVLPEQIALGIRAAGWFDALRIL